MNDPIPFEQSYPKEAQFLMDIYKQEPKYKDKQGNLHYLPYYLYAGKDYCAHIPFD